MSEQSDYDRLRADIQRLRDEHFKRRSGWPVLMLDELLERHPARDVPIERHCSECDPSFSCFLGRAPCSKVPPPTPARATTPHEDRLAVVVNAAIQYVVNHGPCDDADEDSDDACCKERTCDYCGLARKLDELGELEL